MKKWVKFDIDLPFNLLKMILRSGKMIGSDQVIINFDEASVQWRKNKIHLGEGIFKYKLYRPLSLT
jgi:hypothetical protein